LPEPAEYALIQFTSGSTGDPKGVALTHAGLLANLRAFGERVGVQASDAVVNWLPLASNLGLGSWLFSLYHGTPLTQISPHTFHTRPESWFTAIHDSRGTISAAPNSAYELCTRRIPQWALEGMDLSCWRSALVAGEAVQPETLERFTRRFAFTGIRPDVMLPCYGLSENSLGLAVPQSPIHSVIPHRSGAVPMGIALEGTEVRVVDADATGEGRLEFRGTSVCAGYWSHGKLVPMASAEGWVDTGDRGILEHGEILVIGRDKESIRKEERNLAPHWIEAAAVEIPSILPGGVVAFGVADQTTGFERLVVAAESTAEPHDIGRVKAAIADRVTAAVGVAPDEILLVPPKSLPKAADGKLRRGGARAMYRSGTLGSAPSGPRSQMAGLWFAHFPALLARGVRTGFSATGRRLAEALAATIAVLGGCLARLPGLRGTVSPLARMVLWILGHTVRAQGTPPRVAAVIAVNRTSPLDPMSMMAILRGPAVLCGEDAILGLGGAARFLLRAVVVPRGTSDVELRAGHTVILFPDAPIGAPARRCRFRMEALEAAIEQNKPVAPAAIVRIEGRTVVQFANAVGAPDEDARGLRNQIRTRIAELFA
jgi:hypothetical protein